MGNNNNFFYFYYVSILPNDMGKYIFIVFYVQPSDFKKEKKKEKKKERKREQERERRRERARERVNLHFKNWYHLYKKDVKDFDS